MMIVITLIATPVLSYAQQQTNYVATLSGRNMVPPVNTHAIGVARFHMNPDGSLCYSVDVYHITGVLGSHIGTKNGTELADLINPYVTMQFYPTGTIGAYPTASVNGTLTSGDIKAGIRGPPGKGGVVSPLGLVGQLVGKNVTDLDNKSKNASVTVRTLDHQRGEIQGQIHPTSSTVGCLTTMRFAPPSTVPSPNSTRY
jgi:hypothetical protein